MILIDRYVNERQRGFDSDDVVQVALFKAFQNLRSYDFNFRFSTWLYTIAFRVAQDHLRRNRRWAKHLSFGAIDGQIDNDSFRSEQEFLRVDASDQAENIWSLARSLLTVEQYSALWLRYGEDLEISEISEVTGKNPSAVRVLLHRSRVAILEHYSSKDSKVIPGREQPRSGASP